MMRTHLLLLLVFTLVALLFTFSSPHGRLVSPEPYRTYGPVPTDHDDEPMCFHPGTPISGRNTCKVIPSIGYNKTCRGLPRLKHSPLRYRPGQVIPMVFKLKSNHPGACYIQIIDQDDYGHYRLVRTLWNLGRFCGFDKVCDRRDMLCTAKVNKRDELFRVEVKLPEDLPPCKRCTLRWVWMTMERDFPVNKAGDTVDGQQYDTCVDFTLEGAAQGVGGAGGEGRPLYASTQVRPVGQVPLPTVTVTHTLVAPQAPVTTQQYEPADSYFA